MVKIRHSSVNWRSLYRQNLWGTTWLAASNEESQELLPFSSIDGFTTDRMTCPDCLRPFNRCSRKG